MSVHWADDHCEWLKRHFPEVADVPLYIHTAGELPEIVRLPHATAWTADSLDVRLRPILEPRDKWRGRGVAIMVEDAFFALTWLDQIGVCAHELAHGFEGWDSPKRNADFEWTKEDEWLAQPGNIDLVCAALKIELITDADSHAATFTRAALHCHRRCHRELSLDHLCAFSPRYGSPDPLVAIEALRSELDEGGNIVDVMRTPMPQAFTELWSMK